MLESFKTKYRAVITQEAASKTYLRNISLLKGIFALIFSLMLLTYGLFFHKVLIYGLPRFIRMRYHPAILNNPSLSFMTYMFDQMFLLIGFLLLCLLFVMMAFFAFDICQRNRVIQELSEFKEKAIKPQAESNATNLASQSSRPSK